MLMETISPKQNQALQNNYYTVNADPRETHYDFCVRNGFEEYIDRMIAIDYIILNRDRHGANIEILRNSRMHALRIASLFDHGLSLIYPCMTDADAAAFDPLSDILCNN
ncbi:hypothetical protein [Butyrivibrio sp. AC2005]|uniref:hypothetical protein n=1 Tax=Butyrivibrio sp. AC2005 TaxID=1280672 RepID=UPI001A986E3B|nr:hypothetical protein [Butyrivibrio sp. AC2005]